MKYIKLKKIKLAKRIYSVASKTNSIYKVTISSVTPPCVSKAALHKRQSSFWSNMATESYHKERSNTHLFILIFLLEYESHLLPRKFEDSAFLFLFFLLLSCVLEFISYFFYFLTYSTYKFYILIKRSFILILKLPLPHFKNQYLI